MALWQQARGEFIDVIDWSEDGSDTLVWRFERRGNAIKWGAQLTVREGQRAVFVNEGRVADCLTSLLALPTAFESPFKAEVGCTASAATRCGPPIEPRLLTPQSGASRVDAR